jgi:hypothetical protein
LIHPTKEKDSRGSYNTATGVFTCPAPGDYRVTGAMAFNSFAASTAPNAIVLSVSRNAVTVSELGRSVATGTSQQCASGSAVVTNCLAGDALTVVGYQGSNVTTQSLLPIAAINHVSFERI